MVRLVCVPLAPRRKPAASASGRAFSSGNRQRKDAGIASMKSTFIATAAFVKIIRIIRRQTCRRIIRNASSRTPRTNASPFLSNFACWASLSRAFSDGNARIDKIDDYASPLRTSPNTGRILPPIVLSRAAMSVRTPKNACREQATLPLVPPVAAVAVEHRPNVVRPVFRRRRIGGKDVRKNYAPIRPFSNGLSLSSGYAEG